MSMDESLADIYYERLMDTNNPVGTLVSFYKDLFSIDRVDESVYRAFARLYRIYGRELIYYSLLDCSDMENINLDSGISGLLSYYAKKRIEGRAKFEKPVNLSNLVKEYEASLENKKRVKIPKNPFDGDDNE